MVDVIAVREAVQRRGGGALVDVGLDKHLDEVAVRHDVSEEAGGGQTRSADHMAMDADETSQL